VLAPVEVTHFTDPTCPWCYGAEPTLRALEHRYGDGLRWRNVMVGLREDTSDLEAAGVRPETRAASWLWLTERFGVPVSGAPRARLTHSGLACRAVKAAELQSPELGAAYLRVLRRLHFATTRLADDEDDLVAAADGVPGLDGERLRVALRDGSAEAAYHADWRETRALPPRVRTVAGAQARVVPMPDGGVRAGAPTLVFERHGAVLVAAGWQPLPAYDLCVANLAPDLPRRGLPSLAEALASDPGGLSTAELARLVTDDEEEPDIDATRDALAALVAAGEAERLPLAGDALWRVRPG
jgi:predicted DsbA family dithiol-disulfide isomerase